MSIGAALHPGLDEAERVRADMYRFLSAMLVRPPTTETLVRLAALPSDDSPIGKARAALSAAAGATDEAAVAREFHNLFIGLGRGEVVPFGSYYLTGFLHEKPLADLRLDMTRLGIERAEGVHEPEDHIGSVSEMMAGLILGTYGQSADLARQKRFFERHFGNWAGTFFSDLERAQAATFYRPVGTLGRLFVEIEATAFAMEP